MYIYTHTHIYIYIYIYIYTHSDRSGSTALSYWNCVITLVGGWWGQGIAHVFTHCMMKKHTHIYIYIYIYIYTYIHTHTHTHTHTHKWVERLPMVWENWVQSHVMSYQRPVLANQQRRRYISGVNTRCHLPHAMFVQLNLLKHSISSGLPGSDYAELWKYQFFSGIKVVYIFIIIC